MKGARFNERAQLCDVENGEIEPLDLINSIN